MIEQPQLCKHGVLGWSKCKKCQIEYQRKYRKEWQEKLKMGIKPRKCIHGKPQLYIHGVLVQSKCSKCILEKKNNEKLNQIKKRVRNRREYKKLYAREWRKKQRRRQRWKARVGLYADGRVN